MTCGDKWDHPGKPRHDCRHAEQPTRHALGYFSLPETLVCCGCELFQDVVTRSQFTLASVED